MVSPLEKGCCGGISLLTPAAVRTASVARPGQTQWRGGGGGGEHLVERKTTVPPNVMVEARFADVMLPRMARVGAGWTK